ncbi:MAG: Crp/Fnr family transcriptional regulator [Gammaproteobacteria bacterium]|nr:Crp/Fnr family transcriptional regulator [Gammaproteobacteria bacterium]
MSRDEKKLQQLFSQLAKAERENLLSYAEFLALRAESEPSNIVEIVAIERPRQETLMAALKRLSRTYPMLDKSKLLHETTALTAQHLMQGREASEVIDECELLFQRHYLQIKNNK